MFTGKRRSHTKMSPLPRVLAYQWNALTNLYGMLGGENLGVMVCEWVALWSCSLP